MLPPIRAQVIFSCLYWQQKLVLYCCADLDQCSAPKLTTFSVWRLHIASCSLVPYLSWNRDIHFTNLLKTLYDSELFLAIPLLSSSACSASTMQLARTGGTGEEVAPAVFLAPDTRIWGVRWTKQLPHILF